MKTLFVSGTDTEVGKTWISCQILRQLRRNGHRVGAWKPVCSGAIEQDGRLIWEDVQSLAFAIGSDLMDPTVTDRICSQRFSAPLSPNIAARLEGCSVSNHELAAGLDAWDGHADLVLIEGAGGLLSPTSDQMLVADLAMQLGSPLLLVSANRLGTIHQTLATVEAAQSRGLAVAAVILNQVFEDLDPVLQQANEDELRRLLPTVPLFVTPHVESLTEHSLQIDFAHWFQPTSRSE